MPVPQWLRHAFALDETDHVVPNEIQRETIEGLVREVVRRRLTTPAMIALEACAPLNFVSAQTLVFFQPMVASFAGSPAYDELTAFLAQRGSVDYIRDRLEIVEREAARKELKPTPTA